MPTTREDEEDEDLVVEAPGIVLAEQEEFRMFLGLADERDGLAAGQPGDDAAADEEHGQGRDEGRNAQDRDEGAVDQSDGQPDGQRPDDRDGTVPVLK